jgi:short-subunit dehydrogenase
MGYGCSKAGVIHLAENLMQDLEGTGLEVSIINPGFVKTRLTDKNTFEMPMRISPERAAGHIMRGLEKGAYEIHFPKGFTWPLKCIAALPARLYFWLSRKLM